VPVIDKSTPIPETGPGSPGYTPPGTTPTSGLGLTDLQKIALGYVLINGILYPPTAPEVQNYEYGPLDPTRWGAVGQIGNPGLNPGYVRPQPFYNTTNAVQGRYDWSAKPYQPGPTFNQALYNTVPNAPAQAFGLQQMYTPTNINQFVSQYMPPLPPLPPAQTPAQQIAPVTGPIAPRV
jgi:hypothetical protein